VEYRYYTVEKREDGYRVYGWRELPTTAALKAQEFGNDVVATFRDETAALRAFPHAKTIMRGKSLLLRPTWPEERSKPGEKVWTITYLTRKRQYRRRAASSAALTLSRSAGGETTSTSPANLRTSITSSRSSA
jgi:hypothetical protein